MSRHLHYSLVMRGHGLELSLETDDRERVASVLSAFTKSPSSSYAIIDNATDLEDEDYQHPVPVDPSLPREHCQPYYSVTLSTVSRLEPYEELGLSQDEAEEAIDEGWTLEDVRRELMEQADEAMGPGVRAEVQEVEDFERLGPLGIAQREAGMTPHDERSTQC